MENMHSKEDKNLFVALKQGDSAAFEAIFRKYHSTLCKTANRLVNDTFAAEEIVQELFLDIWKKRFQLETPQSPAAYLHKATIFKSYDFLRKKIKDQEKLSFPEQVPPHSITPFGKEEELMADDLKVAIYKTIQELPPRCQLIFKLNRFEHLSYREIAQQLNISQKSVEKQISKALVQLRKAVFTIAFFFTF